MSKQYQYCVIGSFVTGKDTFSGQAVKTRNFTSELEARLGQAQVCRVDTYGWKKHPVRLLTKIIKGMKNSEQAVVLPARRGVYVIPRIVQVLNGVFHNKLRYVVIGGWLPEFVKCSASLKKNLLSFDSIHVETNTMKKALNSMGLQNICLLPNFKRIQVLSMEELVQSEQIPLRLCTFSRVIKQKGIEDAVEAVRKINEKYQKTVYCLDIYGKVGETESAWFEGLQQRFPTSVRYHGAVDPSKSVEILKDYFMLLFPTRFFTEGVPGTLIDAYAAGVPVVVSRWESYADVMDEGLSGKSYPFGDEAALCSLLDNIAQNPAEMNRMKAYCLMKAKEFSPETVIQDFITTR